MAARVPEENGKPGVSYAVTDDGLELPVIDITHPAFAVNMTEEQVSRVIDETMEGLRATAKLSPEALRALPARSILLRGTLEAPGGIMTGMMTYLNRLGPDNLGAGYASDLDRAQAKTMMPLSFRFRLRDVAHALAGAVARTIAASPAGRRIEFVNIAGGPAMDSLNALILLQRDTPAVLSGRSLRLRVLDLDAAGPHFGARALDALRSPGGALFGVDVSFEHLEYDWSHPWRLRDILEGLEAPAVGSSEGGLFDYGSDETIVANLVALRESTPPDFVMVGSVVRDVETLDPRLRITATARNRPVVRYLGLKAFGALALQAGWAMEGTLDSTAHHVVTLTKAVAASPAPSR